MYVGTYIHIVHTYSEVLGVHLLTHCMAFDGVSSQGRCFHPVWGLHSRKPPFINNVWSYRLGSIGP